MNTWAPELFYDGPTGQYLVVWATTVPGRFPRTDGQGSGRYNHRLYYVTTTDFTTFSPDIRLAFSDRAAGHRPIIEQVAVGVAGAGDE